MSDSEQVLDFSPGPQVNNRTRSLVIELVVRQAAAGEDWRQKSATMLQQHQISPDEIEAELVRRQERRSGRREEGSQRRARVLTEVLREMPPDAPREQIVAAFRDRYNQPDRRRARDQAPDHAEPTMEGNPAGGAQSDVDTLKQPETGAKDENSAAEQQTATHSTVEPSNQETNTEENKKPWWKRVMFWIK